MDGAVVMVENIHRQLALRHGTAYRIREVIAAAAAEVDRPIFYAVAVIVAGFLPIYVLSGPVGQAVQADGRHDDLRAGRARWSSPSRCCPSCASVVLRGGVRERRNAVFERLKALYGRHLDWCLARPRPTVWASAAVFGVSLLAGAGHRRRVHAAPRRGRAVGPRHDAVHHLVRGGVEALARRCARSSASFPEVTDVANEHGRDDGGTDPTGFFNDEFYVGLKPYGEWHGATAPRRSSSPTSTRSCGRSPASSSTTRSPPRTRWTRRRRASRARSTSRCSAPTSTRSRRSGLEIKHVLEKVRGITEVTLVQELGQPSLTVTPDRAKIARYGINVADVNNLIEAAVGGSAATQVVQGERLFDLVVRLEPQYRQTPEADRPNILVATPGGQQVPLKDLAGDLGGQRRVVHLPPEQRALHRHPVLRRGPRPGERGARRPAAGGRGGAAPPGLPRGVGRRIPGVHGVAAAAAARRCRSPCS